MGAPQAPEWAHLLTLVWVTQATHSPHTAPENFCATCLLLVTASSSLPAFLPSGPSTHSRSTRGPFTMAFPALF